MKSVIRILVLLLLIQLLQIQFSYSYANTVEVIYFYPNDKVPQTGIDATLDTKLKNAQSLYLSVMELYGYGRKTFDIDTDSDGDVVVNHFQGDFNDTYYHDDTFSKVITELSHSYNSSQNVYYVAIDVNVDVFEVDIGDTQVRACGVALSKWGATPAQGSCFNYIVIAHELGHTFGLEHDVFSTGNIDPMINSPCAAAWLDVHPCFNGGNTDSGSTHIEVLSPKISPEGEIRYSFDVSDPDGLYLTHIFIYELDSIVACNQLQDNSGIIRFDTSYIPNSDPTARITIMDRKGNYSGYLFNLITTQQVDSDEITFPDSNLERIIREQLNLSESEKINNRQIARLTSLTLTDSNRPISSLSGIEKAINLDTLIINNQSTLTDFTPVSFLSDLSNLEISNSSFTNLTILSNLTNLQSLTLSGNEIQDITELAALTNLNTLDLSDNEITDFSPLFSLTNLKTLWLTGNTISDRSQLLTLKEQNPELELFIDIDTAIPNNDPMFLEDTNAVRWVLENSPIGTRIGSSISASDIDLDTLTYSITGFSDIGVFRINSRTGQLTTNAILDYDEKNKYTINISVSDGRNGSASITVTVNVAPAGGQVIIPELIPIHVSFSELMIPSRGGVHSLPQWLELYNGSKTEIANLRGWQLAIEARDQNGKHRHAIIPLKELIIPPGQTGLIVTWSARQKSDQINEKQIYSLFAHHFDEFEQNQYRNMLIGLAGFSLKLTNREGLLVDIIGNIDGDPSTEDEPIWNVPIQTTKNAQRISIIRRYAKDTLLPLDGTQENSWRSTADISLTVSTYWGTSKDIGNPGYRGEGTLPVTLSHFHAIKTQDGSVITWITESEIDNAGFYLLRSETKDGIYKNITPKLIQGAGTSSQRKRYSWIDTTIHEKTRYYYRIVDVSYAGLQRQLATVGMRGLLSPDEKKLTIWADLKHR
ncbi:cadherin domain-containing protein [Candidatus Poribacteria bacterium]|nr:cadherin domain-containing protein [Candidatus Poribacteria bacterium]